MNLTMAPSEVVEALNRLLDDNRELFIPETQEILTPHPNFMLFATQNPPGMYGGRKTLSRAFRNRFIEVHIEDMPLGEWEELLVERCKHLAKGHARSLVGVLGDLYVERMQSNALAGGRGFMTPRDMFRWAERGSCTEEGLARDGFMLIGEKLRSSCDRERVLEIMQRHFPRVDMVPDQWYSMEPSLCPGRPDDERRAEMTALPVNEDGVTAVGAGLSKRDQRRKRKEELLKDNGAGKAAGGRASVSIVGNAVLSNLRVRDSEREAWDSMGFGARLLVLKCDCCYF